jgi:ribosome-associated protein
MEDMLTKTTALAALLEEHRAADVRVLDLRQMNAWTDYFVIATISSRAHLEGLLRHIKDFAAEQELEIRRTPRRNRLPDEESQFGLWVLVDLGDAVVHLMSREARDFYELERLWSTPLKA